MASDKHYKGAMRVATKEEYERALLKAEISGLSSLRKDEVELLKRLVKEMSPLGSRARQLING
jgi:hypothetical protein